jgi:hypothetical protein
LGIGTSSPQVALQINGALEIGNDSDPCNSSTGLKFGAMRWTGTDLEVCNLNGWTAIQYSGGSPNLPSQCFTYTVINDATRTIRFGAGALCDGGGTPLAAGNYRFIASGNSTIPTSPPPVNSCDTAATGWYSATNDPVGSPGVMPGTIGQTTSGFACYNWSTTCTATWSNAMTVTNCDGYYVYFLNPSVTCSLRYCTTGP